MGTVNGNNGFKLPILGEEDIDAQLKADSKQVASTIV